MGLYMCRELCRQMDGEIKLIIDIDKSIGEKAFVLNVGAKVLLQEDTAQTKNIELD